MSANNPPKILFFIPNLDNQGIQIIWLIKIKEYQKLGYATYLHGGVFISEIKTINDVYDFDVEHNKIKSKPKQFKSKISYLFYTLSRNIISLRNYQEIKKISPDIVYSFSSVLDFLIVPYIYKRKNKKTIWCAVFDNTVPFLGRGNLMIRALAWMFFKMSLLLLFQADCIFTVTANLKKYLLVHGIQSQNVIVTGNGVEQDLIYKIKKDKKYSSDGLYMGRLNESKGIYDLLKVLEIVIKKYPNFKLNILGSGDQRTETIFKNKINKSGLTHNIFLLGYRTGIEKYSYLRNTKSFWFLSYDESFGVALLEAVALGKHCFTYNLPAFRQIYKKGEIKMHKIGDYKNVASDIIKQFETRVYTNEKGKRLIEKYSWSEIVRKEDSLIGRFFKQKV